MIQNIKVRLLSFKIIFEILNYTALFFYLIKNKFVKVKYQRSKIRKVALIFNKCHFDPNLSDEFNEKYTHAGSVVWARFFYNYLKDKCEVTLLDLHDDNVQKDNYDLVIGLVSKNFLNICCNNKKAYKILFAVNSHPFYRNKIIIDECKYFNIPLILMEMVNPFLYHNCINKADKIFLLGNDFIRHTYLKFGIPSDKINTFSGMPDQNAFKKLIKSDKDGVMIVYPAGFNGVRKGLLRFACSARNLLLKKKFTQLTILGGFDKNVRSKVLDIFKVVENKVHYKDWLSHDELVSQLNTADIAVLISLEEGRVYSILEAISCGCIPLVSKNCGIDLPEDYLINNPYDKDEIYNKINYLIDNIDYYRNLNASLLTYLGESVRQNNCEEKLDELF